MHMYIYTNGKHMHIRAHTLLSYYDIYQQGNSISEKNLIDFLASLLYMFSLEIIARIVVV